MGAVECHIIDATKEFSDDYVSYAIKGNLMYENAYPLVSALSRPLIAKKLVEIAEKQILLVLRMDVLVKVIKEYVSKWQSKL